MRALMQLTIDGREVPHEVVALQARQPPRRGLTAVQRAILDTVREAGSIRTVQAGVIAHRHRNSCGFGARSGSFTGRGIGCCPYAGPDGLAALKRLRRRGLVFRDESQPGRWIAT